MIEENSRIQSQNQCFTVGCEKDLKHLMLNSLAIKVNCMVIGREEMQEIVRGYKEPVGLNLGSHSALDAWGGQRNYNLRSLIYTTPSRARIYLQNPMVGKPDEPIDDLPGLARKNLRVIND